MVIKYLISGGGKDCLFLACGVILSGTVTDKNHDNQKRIIQSMLSKHVSSEFYNSMIKQNTSSNEGAGSSSSTTVEEIDSPTHGDWTLPQ